MYCRAFGSIIIRICDMRRLSMNIIYPILHLYSFDHKNTDEAIYFYQEITTRLYEHIFEMNIPVFVSKIHSKQGRRVFFDATLPS